MRYAVPLLIAALHLVAVAQVPSEHKLSIDGSATIVVPADLAVFTFEVEGFGSSLRAAVSQALEKANGIAVQLQRLGIQSRDIQIGGFQSGDNLDKAFFSSKKDFSARISATVTVKEMSIVTSAMYAVSDAQPISISAVNYSVSAIDSLRTEALLQAAANARAIGDRLAAKLGVTIRGVVDASEAGQLFVRGGRAASVEYSGYQILDDQTIRIDRNIRVVFAL